MEESWRRSEAHGVSVCRFNLADENDLSANVGRSGVPSCYDPFCFSLRYFSSAFVSHGPTSVVVPSLFFIRYGWPLR